MVRCPHCMRMRRISVTPSHVLCADRRHGLRSGIDVLQLRCVLVPFLGHAGTDAAPGRIPAANSVQRNRKWIAGRHASEEPYWQQQGVHRAGRIRKFGLIQSLFLVSLKIGSDGRDSRPTMSPKATFRPSLSRPGDNGSTGPCILFRRRGYPGPADGGQPLPERQRRLRVSRETYVPGLDIEDVECWSEIGKSPEPALFPLWIPTWPQMRAPSERSKSPHGPGPLGSYASPLVLMRRSRRVHLLT